MARGAPCLCCSSHIFKILLSWGSGLQSCPLSHWSLIEINGFLVEIRRTLLLQTADGGQGFGWYFMKKKLWAHQTTKKTFCYLPFFMSEVILKWIWSQYGPVLSEDLSSVQISLSSDSPVLSQYIHSRCSKCYILELWGQEHTQFLYWSLGKGTHLFKHTIFQKHYCSYFHRPLMIERVKNQCFQKSQMDFCIDTNTVYS